MQFLGSVHMQYFTIYFFFNFKKYYVQSLHEKEIWLLGNIYYISVSKIIFKGGKLGVINI